MREQRFWKLHLKTSEKHCLFKVWQSIVNDPPSLRVSRIAFDFQEGPLSPDASSDCLPSWSIWLWRKGIRIMPLDDCWRWHELAGLKAPNPRERTTSTTHKMMLQRWLWAMLVCLWCTGIQAINNVTISNSSERFKSPRNNSEETAETNVQ